jgi:peroxiredoxin Q/BCP
MSLLREGQSAPDFAAQTDENKTLRLKDLRGKWVVLYWFPKADTPG